MQVNDGMKGGREEGEEEENVSSAASIYFKSLTLHLSGIKNINSLYELLVGRHQERTSFVLNRRIERKVALEYISYQFRNQLC